MAPNRMFQQQTGQNEKNQKFSQIFKLWRERITSIPLSLPHWIQFTSIRVENRDFGKTGKSLMKQAKLAKACIHYVMWRI